MPGSDAETPQPPGGQLLIYQDGGLKLQVRLDGETVWLTQAAMAELFQTSKQNISLHLQNIFDDKELLQEAVVKEYLTTAADGKRYRTLHYNLDAILAVGYRVRSPRGTAFRQWATARLSELLVKGFTLDDERKNSLRRTQRARRNIICWGGNGLQQDKIEEVPGNIEKQGVKTRTARLSSLFLLASFSPRSPR